MKEVLAPRYSWYVRLGAGRGIDSPLAGVVRLETPATVPLATASRLADVSARLLPELASDATHDARAPQNLHAIGALEARLRHLMGDSLLVRRAIERQLDVDLASAGPEEVLETAPAIGSAHGR
jgi:hypothetical protein